MPLLTDDDPRYTVRRAQRAVTDLPALEEILRAAPVLRLGLWDGTEPYVVPLSFGYAEGALYFHSSLVGRKMEALRRFPRVCFEVDVDPENVTADKNCDWSVHYRSVIGWGVAEELADPAAKADALNCIMAHYGGPAQDYTEAELARVAVVRIAIERLTGKQA
jgi:hypothetical protein